MCVMYTHTQVKLHHFHYDNRFLRLGIEQLNESVFQRQSIECIFISITNIIMHIL